MLGTKGWNLRGHIRIFHHNEIHLETKKKVKSLSRTINKIQFLSYLINKNQEIPDLGGEKNHALTKVENSTLVIVVLANSSLRQKNILTKKNDKLTISKLRTSVY